MREALGLSRIQVPMADDTLIHTTKGLVPLSQLEVKDIVSYTANSRDMATEWRKDGELVRRDVWVSILRGHSLAGEQGAV